MAKDGNHFVLMGLKHSGKSSICRLASRDLRLPAIDLDDKIAELARGRYPELKEFVETAPCVRHFYLKYGKEAFYAAEAEAAGEIVKVSGNWLLALGGGTMENSEAMAALHSQTKIIFLDTPCDALFRRIIKGGIPAFLDPARPEEHFKEIFSRRRKLALEFADFPINLESKNLDEAYAEVKAIIKEQLDARQ